MFTQTSLRFAPDSTIEKAINNAGIGSMPNLDMRQ